MVYSYILNPKLIISIGPILWKLHEITDQVVHIVTILNADRNQRELVLRRIAAIHPNFHIC